MNRNSTETVRERLAGKARARAVLRDLTEHLSLVGGNRQIKRGHAYQMNEENLERMRHAVRSFLAQARQYGSATERIIEEMEQLSLAAYRILEALAVDSLQAAVLESDLDLLTNMITRDLGPIRFDSAQKAWTRSHSAESPTAALANSLLEYMNLSANYGPEHAICIQCRSLMISGRGAKKYCSPECRKEAWTYEQKKDYYQEHRSDSRIYKKIKSKKGTTHGRSKTHR